MVSNSFSHPVILNMTDETITENVNIINSQSGDARFQFILHRLVQHLHDFARETRLTTEEWMAGIEFLTQVGQMCSDTRQEMIILSDTLGLSVLVDGMSHPKPKNATAGTLLGPFHTHDALTYENGESICSDGKGEMCVLTCTLKDTSGNPIEGGSIDIWETDETGRYDTQYSDRGGPDCRGIVKSDEDGNFWIKCVKPVSYAIPLEGPVGKMLQKLNRHSYRPAHIHFKLDKDGYDQLITALYLKGDKYETSDVVFGVKSELIVNASKIEDSKFAAKYGVQVGDWHIHKDFVLVGNEEAKALFVEKSRDALDKISVRANLINGLPVADLD
jgi:protocatechuate 3,4-dioxygenase beta subunit